MKKCLEILDFEDKKTQSGKAYVRFKTNEGWMSCFDSKSSAVLKEYKGSSANCEVAESGEFQNIKKFLDIDGVEVKTEKIKDVKIEKPTNEFPKSMKVSYCKDCFVGIITRISQAKFDEMTPEEVLELMDLSIAAIEKAEAHFK
jgi:hypothetical protein